MSTTKLVAPSSSGGTEIQTEYGNYTVASDNTVTVDSRAVTALIGAGYTIFSDDLPVGKAQTAGAHTITSGEATANAAVIATGLSAVDAMVVQVLDSGNNVITADADVTTATGDITVADGTTYNTVAGSTIHWFAFGDA